MTFFGENGGTKIACPGGSKTPPKSSQNWNQTLALISTPSPQNPLQIRSEGVSIVPHKLKITSFLQFLQWNLRTQLTVEEDLWFRLRRDDALFTSEQTYIRMLQRLFSHLRSCYLAKWRKR